MWYGGSCRVFSFSACLQFFLFFLSSSLLLKLQPVFLHFLIFSSLFLRQFPWQFFLILSACQRAFPNFQFHRLSFLQYLRQPFSRYVDVTAPRSLTHRPMTYAYLPTTPVFVCECFSPYKWTVSELLSSSTL